MLWQGFGFPPNPKATFKRDCLRILSKESKLGKVFSESVSVDEDTWRRISKPMLDPSERLKKPQIQSWFTENNRNRKRKQAAANALIKFKYRFSIQNNEGCCFLLGRLLLHFLLHQKVDGSFYLHCLLYFISSLLLEEEEIAHDAAVAES